MKQFSIVRTIIDIILLWYVFIFSLFELLSLLGLLTRPAVLLLSGIFIGWVSYRFKNSLKTKIEFNKFDILVGILLLLTFIQGFFSAPNTTDSLVYHLPRIIHWLQSGTVFQKEIINQHDFMPPFAEYLDLYYYMLVGGDRLIFLSQWVAYLGSILVSGLIVKRISNNSKFLIGWVRLSVAVIPMVLFQATSTQTDLITGFLFLTSILYALEFYSKYRYKKLLYFLVSCYLGFLTKPSFAIFALIPLGLIIYKIFVIKKRSIDYVSLIAITVISSAVFLSGFFYQNIILYHSLIGSWEGNQIILTNEFFSFGQVISNLIRNIFIHLPIPLINIHIQQGLVLFHELLGISINDPRTTWYNTKFIISPILIPQEDLIGNPIQLLLFIFALLVLLKNKVGSRLLFYLFFAVIVSFIFFCILLKWQPWNSRLHLPLFLLAVIISTIVLDRYQMLLRITSGLSFLLAVVLILFNVSRPFFSYNLLMPYIGKYSVNSQIPQSIFIKPRDEQFFNSRPYWYEPYKLIVKDLQINNPATISFDLMDGHEYPLVALYPEQSQFPEIRKRDSEVILYTATEINNNLENKICYKTEIQYGYVCLAKKR